MSGGLLNIAALSRRTGVAADTLRKWEQRYGVLHPERTAGGQRRYTELDVDRVEWLLERLAEGYRIGEAAALLGAGTAEAPRTPADLLRGLLRAARAADGVLLEGLLDHVFALDTATAFGEVLEPLLVEVGRAWEAGELSVAQEHLVTQAVRARLARRVAELRGGVRGTAVLACVPGERHDVGLLMLAVLLRADGWQVAYLGADTPVAEAARFALAARADLLCLSATLPGGLELLELPPTHRPAIVIGGAAARPEVAARLGARVLPGSGLAAVERLRALAG